VTHHIHATEIYKNFTAHMLDGPRPGQFHTHACTPEDMPERFRWGLGHYVQVRQTCVELDGEWLLWACYRYQLDPTYAGILDDDE